MEKEEKATLSNVYQHQGPNQSAYRRVQRRYYEYQELIETTFIKGKNKGSVYRNRGY